MGLFVGRSWSSRSMFALIAVAGMASPLAAAGPAAAAGEVTSATSSTTIGSAPDFATETFADPWDYSNPEDENLSAGGPMLAVANQQIAGGRLSYDSTANGYFSPVWGGYPGSQYAGRDGAIHPVDAARYTKISFRMYASSNVGAGLMWFNCGGLDPACEGGQPFGTVAGWHTYDMVFANSGYRLPAAWAGQISGLRVVAAADAGVHIEVDWMRLYQPRPDFAVTPSLGRTLCWDSDQNPSNNTADNSGWGKATDVATTPANSGFPAASYPPGTYNFYSGDANCGAAGSYISSLTIAQPPQPVIDDPDVTGGADYASLSRGGDGWDMSQPSDVSGFGSSANISFANGILTATNAGIPPDQPINDPNFHLAMGPPPIVGSQFHRMTVKMSYDGPFDLRDAPGGGTMARLVWNTASGAGLQEGRPLVTYDHGQQVITVDLATNPPSAVNDPQGANTPVGWAGQLITDVRFDPNEDPGARTWHIDDLRIAENDRGNGSFPIRFHDAAWHPGLTADFYYDRTGAGYAGTPIATGVPVGQGPNSLTWNAANVPAGTYSVYVVEHDSLGSTGRAYSTGPVDLTGPPPPPDPAGAIGAEWRWLGGAGSSLGSAVNTEHDVAGGRAVDFQRGIITWSPATGPHEVHGAILAKYFALGGPAALGLPVTDELPTPDGIGRFNHFSSNSSIYWSPATGAQSVGGGIRAAWAASGWEGGPLGYPVSDEYTVAGGRGSSFQGGDIYWGPNTGTHLVRGAIRAEYLTIGGPGGYGLPITDELPTPDGVGRFSHFSASRSIYWTPSTGAHNVGGAIRGRWAALGWETSFLGYPLSDEADAAGGRISRFAGGSIFWSATSGQTTVGP
jgi:hypothetical protein